MSNLLVPRRQRVGAARTAQPVSASLPLSPSTHSSVAENAVAVPIRRPPQVLVPASPEMSSDPRSSDDRPTRMYAVRGSDIIMDRYRVRSGIGFGSCGTVVRAEDKVTGTAVAIKVLHRDAELHLDVRIEERVYERLLSGCNPSISLFAQVLESGMHQGFHCIVFELCQGTLYDALKGYSGLVPLPARHVVEIAYQILKAVEYLHSLDIVHTDIKLDNVAVRSLETATISWLDPIAGYQEKKILVSSKICLIDLGGAVELQGRGVMHGRIGTQGYRAPEVTLGLPWTREVDHFSVGCVIAETYLARNLFDAGIEVDREYLVAVDRLLGPFPRGYAEDIEAKYPGTFTILDRAAIQYPAPGSSPSATEYAESMRRLERIKPLETRIHDAHLNDLVKRLMAPDPEDRVSLDEASKHSFFDALNRTRWG